MGGTWSGQRGSKKRVVETCTSLDTADLKRMKLLAPGTINRTGALHWESEEKSNSSIGYILTLGETEGTFRFQYGMSESKETFDYQVRLVTTSCHLGGVRWWFICPLTRIKGDVRCGRRVRKLYLNGKYFGCRHCHDLAYRSSQQSDSRVYAAIRSDPHLTAFANPSRMSISQLGFALKVLTFQQKRFERIGKRLDRYDGIVDPDSEQSRPQHITGEPQS